jgi:hypothetical protein
MNLLFHNSFCKKYTYLSDLVNRILIFSGVKISQLVGTLDLLKTSIAIMHIYIYADYH